MAYDESVASRVRVAMKRRKGVGEQKLFGGLAFMLNGHMCCGVLGDELVVRLGNDDVLDALEEDHTRPFDFTGRVIKSMLYIEQAGFADEAQLKKWIDRAVRFTRTLPEKE